MMNLSANFKMSPMFLKVQLRNREKHWNKKALCFCKEQLSQKGIQKNHVWLKNAEINLSFEKHVNKSAILEK